MKIIPGNKEVHFVTTDTGLPLYSGPYPECLRYVLYKEEKKNDNKGRKLKQGK